MMSSAGFTPVWPGGDVVFGQVQMNMNMKLRFCLCDCTGLHSITQMDFRLHADTTTTVKLVILSSNTDTASANLRFVSKESRDLL